MKKLMQNDTFLKIFSLVAAFICWVYILFVTNPEIEVTLTAIPITLSDHQSIKNSGYIVSDEINSTVDIKVRGTRPTLANLDRESVIAYLDLSECTDDGQYELPVNIKLPFQNISLVSKSVNKVSVTVDNYITRDFPVNYSYNGSLKSTNYSIYETKIATPRVSVSGPEDLIKTIESAEIVIELNNASDDISGFAPLVLLNSNDTQVNSKNLDTKTKDISYDCSVYLKKSVKVKPSISESDDTFTVSVTDHPTITLTGPASAVEAIDEITTKPVTISPGRIPYSFYATLVIPEKVTVEENIKTVNVAVNEK